MSKIVKQAAYNNALWCDAVCSAHNCPGEFHEQLWMNRLGTPRYYPDAVTLTDAMTAPAQTEAIFALIQSVRQRSWSVKDSFHCLNLSELGFTPLFDAEWITARLPFSAVRQESADLQWRRVRSEAELFRWEQYWTGADQAVGQSRVFVPRLLSESDIHFILVCHDSVAVGGGVLNRGGGVVGISNLFTLKADTWVVWQGLARAAAASFPGLPLVAYDRGKELAVAHRIGFVTVGRLRIWYRPQSR